MDRRQFLKDSALTVGSTALASHTAFAEPAQSPKAKKPNLLFLMTDQQQSLALSLAGNKIVQTPNLDKLAKSGAFFTNAYTACPVCVPARTSILTGNSTRTTGVVANSAVEHGGDLKGNEGIFSMKTFDEVLVDNGYTAEYYGKWHGRMERATKYANAPHVGKWVEDFRLFMRANNVPAVGPAGTFLDDTWKMPYFPDPNDPAIAKYPLGPPNKKGQVERVGEPIGKLLVPAELSPTAFICKDTINALERLAKTDKPFSLTCSIPPPHPPYVPTAPYYGMYPAKDMPIPSTIHDPMTNNPFGHSPRRCAFSNNPETVGYLISAYYGLVKEADDWIGKILATLDRLGLRDNTLIVFLSDHGEMLGNHGMYAKFVFLDESDHIPMMFSYAGKIPAGKTITNPVGHIDVFATILDYLNVPAPASEGTSLRGLVDGDKTHKREPFAVSEWAAAGSPAYMTFDGQFKFMFGKKSSSPACLDALYDMKNDPHEMNNLIGNNPDRAKHKAQAETSKEMLLSRLTRIHSADINDVTARPVIT